MQLTWYAYTVAIQVYKIKYKNIQKQTIDSVNRWLANGKMWRSFICSLPEAMANLVE